MKSELSTWWYFLHAALHGEIDTRRPFSTLSHLLARIPSILPQKKTCLCLCTIAFLSPSLFLLRDPTKARVGMWGVDCLHTSAFTIIHPYIRLLDFSSSFHSFIQSLFTSIHVTEIMYSLSRCSRPPHMQCLFQYRPAARVWAKRGIASNVDSKAVEKLPLAGVKVLDMTRVLAGVC